MDWWDMRVLRFLWTWIFVSIVAFLLFSMVRRLLGRAR
jgi:hypothetical protein